MTTNDPFDSPGPGAGGEHPGGTGSPGRPPTGRPLRRSADDRVVAGVAAGLGRWLDVDPVILRVLFAVLSVFGGVGVALYGVCWLLIPEVGDRRSIVDGWLVEGRSRHRPGRTAVLAAIALVVVLAAAAHDVNAAAVLVAVVAVAALATRSRSGYGTAPVAGAPASAAAATAPTAPTIPYGPAPGPAGTAPGDAGAPWAGPDPYADHYAAHPEAAAGAAAPEAPTAPPRRRRTRRRSTSRPVLGAALVAAGVALLVDRTGAAHLTTTQLLAIPLAVLGVALLAGAATGRSWLGMGAGALLTVAVLGAAATHGHFGGDDVTWAPDAGTRPNSSYHLNAGHARLDLTAAGDLSGRHLSADVGAGRLEVVVPPGTPVRVVADVGVGALDLLGDEQGGLGVHRTVTDGPFDTHDGLELDLHVGVGQVKVTRD